jgi:hypothetical protein
MNYQGFTEEMILMCAIGACLSRLWLPTKETWQKHIDSH